MNLFGEFVLAVIVSVIVGLILSYPTMWLWNVCLVPAVSGVSPIGWLQAWGLMVMVGLFRSKMST